jgi:hypothetical protein
MARIIPGVQVTVIKEVVPPQLAPSGVLGLVGLVAPARGGTNRKQVERVGSWARFRQLYGQGSALAMPEAQHALQNGVFELVVVDLASSVAERASATFDVLDAEGWLTFTARAPGTRSNGIRITLTPQRFQGVIQSYEISVSIDNEVIEVHRNLSLFPGDGRFLGKILEDVDSVLELSEVEFTPTDYTTPVNLAAEDDTTSVARLGTATPLDVLRVTKTDGTTAPVRFLRVGDNLRVVRDPMGASPRTLVEAPVAAPDLVVRVRDALAAEDDLEVAVALPEIESSKLTTGGVDASVAEYTQALTLLEDVQDVDLVVAAVQDLTVTRAAQIYGAVIAHCNNMSADAKGRIGFGQVPPGGNVEQDVDLAGSLVSDRFVLFAPNTRGVLGAAVGRIGSLDYYQSPTFKSLAGLGVLEPALRVEAQQSYLRANIVPVVELPGRGNAIVRGLTTDGDQINVRRIADRAVRGVKQIGELFIGKLNTEDGRNALKQKLNEFLLQMQTENAIVPSTDGSDPAFKLAVYSSQADFALGIVRVDLAVRPVRAIDYIYATVLVQV